MTLTKTVTDCTTGEETIVPLDALELSERELRLSEAEKAEADKNALELKNATDKAALLKRLGITAAEAELLLS